MSLWFSQVGRPKKESGKFRPRARLGLQSKPGSEYRGWSYHFTSHSTGTSVKRTVYSVSILDPNENQAAYLRDFRNVDQAAQAAREWIDHTLSLVWPKVAGAGNIPAVPKQETAEASQEK